MCLSLLVCTLYNDQRKEHVTLVQSGKEIELIATKTASGWPSHILCQVNCMCFMVEDESGLIFLIKTSKIIFHDAVHAILKGI